MLGHDDVAYHHKATTLPDFFKDGKKQIAPLRAGQPGLPMITAASDEMPLIRAVVAPEMLGHTASLFVAEKKSCDIRPCKFPPLHKT